MIVVVDPDEAPPELLPLLAAATDLVGKAVANVRVGLGVGREGGSQMAMGMRVGGTVGAAVVGSAEGTGVGRLEGRGEGRVGRGEGRAVGLPGTGEGCSVGMGEGGKASWLKTESVGVHVGPVVEGAVHVGRGVGAKAKRKPVMKGAKRVGVVTVEVSTSTWESCC